MYRAGADVPLESDPPQRKAARVFHLDGGGLAIGAESY